MLQKLWKRTKEVATMYTGTFVVVMILNQLLFFGFCLNPVCLIAAMPHVLFITVIIGTWINKKNGWGSDEVAGKTIKKTAKTLSSTLSEVDRRLDCLNEDLKNKLDQKEIDVNPDEKDTSIDSSSHIGERKNSSDVIIIESNIPDKGKVENKRKNTYVHEEPPPWVDEPPPWLDEIQARENEVPPWLVDEVLSGDFVWGGEKNGFAEKLKEHGISSIWHITHRNNIEEILNKGILSNSLAYQSEKPIDISNKGAQRWRERKEPLCGRTIHEYAPTYLNIKNPMLFVKQDIHDELCLVEISLAVFSSHEFIFTDGNAAARNTNFFRNVNDLTKLPWDVLNASYWNDFPDGKRKRCAEMLIYPLIESHYILKIHCRSVETLKHVQKFNFPAQISGELFFRSGSIAYPSSISPVETSYDDRPF